MKNTQIRIFGIDTAIVLFFLAGEYTRSLRVLSPDALLMAVTMAMVLVLPYFLPSGMNAPSFASWMGGRSAVLFGGLLAGALFSSSLGVVVPESLKLLPMTMLIVTAMVSCYIQFYAMFKLRPVK